MRFLFCIFFYIFLIYGEEKVRCTVLMGMKVYFLPKTLSKTHNVFLLVSKVTLIKF